MKKISLGIVVSLLIFSCKEEVRKPETTEMVQIDHKGEGLFRMDSQWVSGKDTVAVSFSLEAIPDHYVAGTKQGETNVEMHLFEDKRIRISVDDRNWTITKDSLLQFVNKEYLDEAMLEDLQVLVFQPELELYLIEFSARKPLEKDPYHFQAILQKGTLQINTADE